MNTISLTLRKSLALQWLMLLVLLPGLVLFPVPLKANPSGQQVIAGNVNFQGLGTASLDINNLSQAAIINWQNFSIQNGEVTRINQGANAVTLNRVVSGNPTAIYGALQAAQGGVMVINPNGIVVHKGGTIDVAGMLTLSTLDIKNEDFLDKGSNRFSGGSTAGIKNYGAITSDGGDVVMLGSFLQNAQGGTVTANKGVVAFGAGGDMLVEQTVNGSTISVLGGSGSIENSGEISGAAAELKATGNVYSLAIKNDGVVRANGYNFTGGRLTLSGGSTGRVVNTGQLYARNSDGSGGQVSVTGSNVTMGGSVDVSGAEAGLNGGSIDISGANVAIADTAAMTASGAIGGSVSISGIETAVVGGAIDATGHNGAGGAIDATAATLTVGSTASLDVSGATKGGTIRAGGGYQGNDIEILNATTTTVEEGALMIADGADGDGGNIFLWADGDTFFGGEISAQATGLTGNGGFVEVSGKDRLSFRGTVSTLSANGLNGTLLLDPTDVVIGASGAAGITISDTDLVTALGLNNVVIHTSSTGGDPGDITVLSGADALNGYASLNTLSFFAHGDIVINDNIQNNGVGAAGGGITLFAGWDGTGETLFSFDPDAGTFSALPVDPAVTSASILAGDFGDWGQNGGSIVINGSGANEVSVGSAHGETALFGDKISVNGGAGNGGRHGQVGFHNATLNPTGNILLYAKDDITISAIGTTTSGNAQNDAHVIVGHGGSNTTNTATQTGNGDLSGDITVISEDGGLYMRGGNDRSFSRIGHGGYYLVGDKDGNITVSAKVIDMRGQFLPGGGADSSAFTGTSIGHGGGYSHGNGNGFSGDIYVKSESSIYGDSGFALTNGNGAVYWQIGHGGYRAGVIDYSQLEAIGREAPKGPDTGSPSDVLQNHVAYDLEGHSGAIYVEAGGDINVFAGSRSNATSMIGHGGRESHGNHDLVMGSTPSAITTGLKDGITVIAGGDIIFDRKDHPTVVRGSSDTPVQIGLGGLRAGGRFTGDIDIQAGGDFEMHAGHSQSFAQVGHGGFADAGNWNSDRLDYPDLNNNNGFATLSGDISLVAGGNVAMYGGLDGVSNAYAQIGHGGLYRTADGVDAAGNIIQDIRAGHNGDILVDSGGSIIISSKPKDDGSAGATVAGSNNFAMIGHGGYRSNGDHSGKVTVNAVNDILLQAGFGGYEEYDASDDRYDLSQTGVDNFAQIGHGGFASTLYRALYHTLVELDGDGLVNDNRWTAGYNFNGNTLGKGIGFYSDSTISVTAGGNFDIIATDQAGAYRNDHLDGDGNPQVTFDSNNFLTGGAITNVVDDAGILTITAVGHGLTTGDTVRLSDIDAAYNDTFDTVTVVDADTFTLDTITAAGATDIEGTFSLPVERPVIDRAIRGYAMVGHGGYGDNDGNRRMNFDSVTTGDINVDIGGAIALTAGGIDQKDDPFQGTSVGDWNRVEYNFAMIGHGGEFFRSSYDGNITVNAGSDIDVQAGKGFREFSRIGHGGYESGITPNDNGSTTVVGTIDVASAGSISLVGGGSTNMLSRLDDSQFDYAQIGHGAGNMGLTIDDQSITVTAGLNLLVAGGAGNRDAYAHIGHGALNNGDGLFSGDIDVSVGGDLALVKTTGTIIGQDRDGNDIVSVRNYVKIGHGDSDSIGRTKSTGRWDGDINVMVGDNLVSVGGMIGHADPTNGDDALVSRDGNTYIGVGRDDPGTSGGGDLITDENTVFTSSQLGVGSELRLYIPGIGGVDNFIAEGTTLNGTEYTRTPAPDGTRGDELLATEFAFTYVDGLPTGAFTPLGDYPGNTFGNYQIYYSEIVPTVVTPGGGGSGGGGVFIPTFGFNYLPYLFEDFYEVFSRYEELYGYDGYDNGLLAGLSADERVDDERPIRASGWFLEEALDGAFGSRNARRFSDPSDTTSAQEDDEERQRRLRRTTNQVGRGGNAIYVYVPGTNRYSSLRLFGVPSSDIR
ncbi:filamentous hemagglutinin N-terminal domain-containing protein [Verrucomicrobiales bacterium BCK34]|nr:filamentous hemagglutinin N-terminal domain-containing protein [Verrucomicrobiales bacterium BCK34]